MPGCGVAHDFHRHAVNLLKQLTKHNCKCIVRHSAGLHRTNAKSCALLKGRHSQLRSERTCLKGKTKSIAKALILSIWRRSWSH
ncbi:hypothetical protein DR92_4535 (plasmid) [Brucella anthropi]|nr:hypothetical protein DR92_4535 [Brucella anthropi]